MQWLVSNGRGIEINTSGIRYGLDSFHPLPDILARYRKAGGSIITIGSDSHNLQSLGRDFAAATDLLRSLGFRYHCWYKNREPQFAEL
jgi:histidinol-phosphatase (PHP family)